MVPKLKRRLCGPFIVAKQATEPLMAFDGAAAVEGSRASIDQLVLEPLVVPLDVIVLHATSEAACRV